MQGFLQGAGSGWESDLAAAQLGKDLAHLGMELGQFHLGKLGKVGGNVVRDETQCLVPLPNRLF